MGGMLVRNINPIKPGVGGIVRIHPAFIPVTGMFLTTTSSQSVE